jgi:predicted Rossmann fold flavoprotein
MTRDADITIIGAGAAGLMAAIWAGRTNADRRIVVLDGAAEPGAKILASGGGRCNLTNRSVGPADYSGSSGNAIGKVLRRFDVPSTLDFFEEIGVAVEEEDGGKLFPVSGRSRTVRDALFAEARGVGASIEHPWRVESVASVDDGFRIAGPGDDRRTRRLVIATGGQSLPSTGSDGHGFALARSLGLPVTDRLFPALVPLTLPADHFVLGLSGITTRATLTLRSGVGKRLASFTDSTLCTHFGLSGPCALNISRHVLDALREEPDVGLFIDWLPEMTADDLDLGLRDLRKRTVIAGLRDILPERLAQALCSEACAPAERRGDALTRVERAALVDAVKGTPLPVTGHRGFDRAEVTAGGIPLRAIDLKTMESRDRPGLHVCGEICDVDGRIGGFNFQWAWSSGHTAGISV